MQKGDKAQTILEVGGMVPRFARFALAALLLLLMALLGGEPGADYNGKPVTTWVIEGVSGTLEATGRGLLWALPAGLLLGGLAGLWPGRPAGRVLHPLYAALLIHPAFFAMPFLLLKWRIPMSHFLWDLLACTPWVAMAIRDGLAGARDDSGRLQVGPVLAGTVGRLLQQSGNLLVATCLLRTLLPRPASTSLFFLGQVGLLKGPLSLAVYAFGALIGLALLGGLLGDLLVHLSVRRPLPVFWRSRNLVLLGLLLTFLWVGGALAVWGDPLALDLAIRQMEPNAAHLLGTDQYGRDLLARLAATSRGSLAIGLGAALVAAAVGGGVAWLGRRWPGWAPLLTPRSPLPSLLGPLAGGLLAILLGGESLVWVVVGMGIGSWAGPAFAFRRWRTEGGWPGRYGLIGSLALVAAGAMVAEIILTVSQTAPLLQDPTNLTLGRFSQDQLLNGPAAMRFFPIVWAGLAGVALLGHALAEGMGAEAGE